MPGGGDMWLFVPADDGARAPSPMGRGPFPLASPDLIRGSLAETG